MDKTIIEKNLKAVQSRIASACERSGRTTDSVRFVAVTKAVEVEDIKTLIENGITDIAENRIQIAEPKFNDLNALLNEKKITRHMIGHLQTNKVNKALQLFSYMHSVESMSLAKKINNRLGTLQLENNLSETEFHPPIPFPVLVQVNVAQEAQKTGIAVEKLESTLIEFNAFENIVVTGLMAMAPYSDNPETARPVFRDLRLLKENAVEKEWYKSPLTELSMGMSGDFEQAIEEGSTMIRVGSSLYEE